MASIPPISDITMSNAKSYFGRLAQSNYYELYITTDWANGQGMKKFLEDPEVQANYKLSQDFITRDLGLLCSEALLPSSAYATSEIKDNFMGITQEFAHTRMYTDIDLTFYTDRDYKVLGFFEAWMNYISGASSRALAKFEPGYYRRFNYPDFYKHNGIYIRKFEKDYKNNKSSVIYRLKNAFPKSMSSIPISYGGSELLKVSVSLNYDYYYTFRGDSNPPAPQADTTAGNSAGSNTPQQEEFTPLGNSVNELNDLRRSAYLNSTRGKVFGRSQSARDMDSSYGVVRNSRGEAI